MSQQSTHLTTLIQETVEGLGYELWGVTFHPQAKHQTLCVYIESSQGITLDDCSKVSHRLSERLDEVDPIQGAYLLEVSSPGLDRPLFTVEQFERYIGEQVRVEMRSPINGQRRFKGRLLRVAPEAISIEEKRQHIDLLVRDIAKANLIPEI